MDKDILSLELLDQMLVLLLLKFPLVIKLKIKQVTASLNTAVSEKTKTIEKKEEI